MRKILLPLIIAGITLIATACGEKEEYGLCIISSEGAADVNGGKFYLMGRSLQLQFLSRIRVPPANSLKS